MQNKTSNKSFGILFFIVFLIIGSYPLIKGYEPRTWSLLIAIIFLLAAFIYPNVLAPLNKVWFKFGLLLHKVTNPILMGLIYFVVITPMGLCMRLFGKDVLNLKYDKNRKTYWIERTPPGPDANTLINQF